MTYTHATELRVRYAETDRMGVVYYANYLVWCEVGRVELLRSLGRSYAALEAGGVGLAVSEARVRYLSPARFEVRITDEGSGFNPDDVPDPTSPENLERPCGRGLLLMRYYMSEVTFHDGGKTIAMAKLRNGTK